MTWGFFVTEKDIVRDRCPAPVEGIQVNTCRNVRCPNFGVWPLEAAVRGRSAKIKDEYVFVGVGSGNSGLKCKLCGEHAVIKSNLVIVEELERFSSPSLQSRPIACSKVGCANSGLVETDPPSLYQYFGKTAAGSLRLRCKACRNTFSVAVRSTLRHRLRDKTELIYRLLINKSPMRRICEVADVTAPLIYQRIDFLHEQCIQLARVYESKLTSLASPRMGVALDVQEHVVNWSSQSDRRVTRLGAVASADTRSGYVLGAHLDYDPRFDAHDLDLAARECGDPGRKPAFRRYARFFLPFEEDRVDEDDDLPAVPAYPSVAFASIRSTRSLRTSSFSRQGFLMWSACIFTSIAIQAFMEDALLHSDRI